MRTALCLSLLMLAPFSVKAETAFQTDSLNAVRDGQLDAREKSNDIRWFMAGCLLGPVGAIYVTSLDPVPPADRLLGKSPGYIAVYSDTYRKNAQDERMDHAWTGCGIAAGVVLIAVGIGFALLAILAGAASAGG